MTEKMQDITANVPANTVLILATREGTKAGANFDDVDMIAIAIMLAKAKHSLEQLIAGARASIEKHEGARGAAMFDFVYASSACIDQSKVESCVIDKTLK